MICDREWNLPNANQSSLRMPVNVLIGAKILYEDKTIIEGDNPYLMFVIKHELNAEGFTDLGIHASEEVFAARPWIVTVYGLSRSKKQHENQWTEISKIIDRVFEANKDMLTFRYEVTKYLRKNGILLNSIISPTTGLVTTFVKVVTDGIEFEDELNGVTHGNPYSVVPIIDSLETISQSMHNIIETHASSPDTELDMAASAGRIAVSIKKLEEMSNDPTNSIKRTQCMINTLGAQN